MAKHVETVRTLRAHLKQLLLTVMDGLKALRRRCVRVHLDFTGGNFQMVVGAEQCIVRHIERSPAGYQNRCSEPVTPHFRDMHQPYGVTVPTGATRSPNPLGTPFYVCPESISGQSVGLDWQTRTCQVCK